MANKYLKKIERWFRPKIGAMLKGHVRPRADLPTDVRRVLVFPSDSVGDLVVSWPAVSILMRERPDWEYGLVLSSRNRSLVEDLGVATRLHFFDRGKSSIVPRFVRSVRDAGYDVVLDLLVCPSFTRALLATVSAPGAFRVGMDAGRYSHFYSASTPVLSGTGQHMILHYVRALAAFGVSVDESDVRASIPLPASDRDAAQEFKRTCGSRVIGIVRSSWRDSTRWPDDKWTELCRAINRDDPSAKFWVFSVPSERAAAERIAREVDGVVVPPDGPMARSLRVVAAFVGECDLLVTPDTATVHVASALRVPLVALYTDRAPRFGQWHPFRVPCRTPTARDGKWVETIPVEEVLSAVRDLRREVGL